MENFTIHIFGYGETQINSKELSVKVSTDTLTTVTALVEAIFAKKPADNPAVISPFHAINIFGYKDVRWVEKNSFSVKNDEELIRKYLDKPLFRGMLIHKEYYEE